MPLFQSDLPENNTQALEAGNSLPLPASINNPYSTKAFGTPKTYMQVTEWDNAAVPGGWTQTLSGTGAAGVNPQPLDGTMGIYQLGTGVGAGGRAAVRYATSSNLLRTFTDGPYTSFVSKLLPTAVPNINQRTITIGAPLAGTFVVNDVVVNGLGASGTILAINLATTVLTVGSITGTFAIGNTLTSGAKSGLITNVQTGAASALQIGWINTASQVGGASGNTLAIMHDPTNTSGYNPGLITNLFLLARCVSGQVSGATGNTVLDLGVPLTVGVSYDTYEMIYDNLLGEVRVFKNNVLLNTLTNLSNVPGSPGRVIVAGNNLSPTWYQGNTPSTGGQAGWGSTGITIQMDQTITYKVFN